MHTHTQRRERERGPEKEALLKRYKKDLENLKKKFSYKRTNMDTHTYTNRGSAQALQERDRQFEEETSIHKCGGRQRPRDL